MDDKNMIGLDDALKIIIDKIGAIRVPVSEKETIYCLDQVVHDLWECVQAIEKQGQQKEEVTDDV